MAAPMEERFWAKVEKSDGCWQWRAAKDACGYGCFGYEGRVLGAHRVSYILAHGIIPDGLHILHSCDNPACVNPSHLRLGTHQENMDDRNSRGRARGGRHPGELAPQARLTAEDARTIRDLCAHGFLQKDCALLWGVRKATVNDLVLRKTWRHI